MARRPLPDSVDTVIVGGGPASLILSYILHGHIPYYIGGHYDELLDKKLSQQPNLLDISPDAYAHFASSLRYSTQALPVNTLLDTLIRPNADTEINPVSCVEWRYEPEKAVDHVVLTTGSTPGGQWVENPVDASWDIGTLSYSEMLSLPGYSYAEHYKRRRGRELPEFERPSRADVTSYFADYPAAVGIASAIYPSRTAVSTIRSNCGFSMSVTETTSTLRFLNCKRLVLATGIFTRNIRPSAPLSQLFTLNNPELPLLLIGSGFSAADIIISTPPTRKIIHVFKWAPETRPSPLRGCHHQAYPEYAGVYRQMKLAAAAGRRASAAGLGRKKDKFSKQRDWANVYDGLPNAEVKNVFLREGGRCAQVTLLLQDGSTVEHTIGGLAYVVGRRGTLSYLSASLLREVLASDGTQMATPPQQPSRDLARIKHHPSSMVSGRTLRPKVQQSFEVAPHVYVIGSLAGDSLVRHAFGGCASVAGMVMGLTSGGVGCPSMAMNGDASFADTASGAERTNGHILDAAPPGVKANNYE